jgi:hypothetical protein
VKSEAQQWGQTAIAFIASLAGTGTFAVLAYVLCTRVQTLAIVCCGLAALCVIALAFNSIAIIRWWIVIAKRSREAGR